MNTSLPFVHTARRSYRLDELVSKSEASRVRRSRGVFSLGFETLQTGLSRGRRSRNKVSVGEPAEGSFQQQLNTSTILTRVPLGVGLRRFFFCVSSQLLETVARLPLFFHPHLLLDKKPTDQCRKHNAKKQHTPFNDGSLGSRNDEERGKMRKCSMNRRIS